MARNREHNGSLTFQIKEKLDSKLCVGQSKHMAKIAGIDREGIYSWSTYNSYAKHLNYFTAYCKANYGCRTLDECRLYANEWLKDGMSRGLSPYTLKLEVAALSKLYDCKSTAFIPTPSRHRENITRSRLDVVRDKNFSEAKNQPFIEFCRSTGLRRSELESLTGDKLVQREDGYYIHVNQGTKGGRERFSPVVGDVQLVVDRMTAAGNKLVFSKVNTNADIHQFRSDYAVRVYQAAARDISTLKREEIYFCRGNLKGIKYDRAAMLVTSQALGHNRISVIAGHYLR